MKIIFLNVFLSHSKNICVLDEKNGANCGNEMVDFNEEKLAKDKGECEQSESSDITK